MRPRFDGFPIAVLGLYRVRADDPLSHKSMERAVAFGGS